MAFAKALLQAHQQQVAEDPVAVFQERWGLDEKCITYLAQLPPEVQNTVFSDFDHQPHQTNVSARCQAFCRAVFLQYSQQQQQQQQQQLHQQQLQQELLQ